MTKLRQQRKDIQSAGGTELRRQLATAREDLRHLRFRVTANQHKDVRELRSLRRHIARMLTQLHRQLKKKI